MAVLAYKYLSNTKLSILSHTNTHNLLTDILANMFGAEWLRCGIVCICDEKTEVGDDRKQGLAFSCFAKSG
jgi:hypothetical protein